MATPAEEERRYNLVAHALEMLANSNSRHTRRDLFSGESYKPWQIQVIGTLLESGAIEKGGVANAPWYRTKSPGVIDELLDSPEEISNLAYPQAAQGMPRSAPADEESPPRPKRYPVKRKAAQIPQAEEVNDTPSADDELPSDEEFRAIMLKGLAAIAHTMSSMQVRIESLEGALADTQAELKKLHEVWK